MLVFGSDLDGCLANIEPILAERIEKEFGIPESKANRLHFYMHERYEVPQDVMNDFLGSDKCFADDQFWIDALPFEENILEMQKWVVQYHAVPSVITARHTTSRLATEVWMAKHHVPYSNLLMGTKWNKHLAVKWTDCAFMIEDRWEEALTIHLDTEATSYIYRTEYNEKHYVDWEHGVRKGQIDPDKLVWVETYAEITEREFNAH